MAIILIYSLWSLFLRISLELNFHFSYTLAMFLSNVSMMLQQNFNEQISAMKNESKQLLQSLGNK